MGIEVEKENEDEKRVNRETGYILTPENGFKEYEEVVLHGNYGARRFFTISYNDFIDNFKLDEKNYQEIIE